MKKYRLKAREIPLDDSFDVVVVGGGPSGCTAAAAAAREGARTLLIEATSALGGMGTSGLVPAWCPFSDKTRIIYGGLAQQVFEKLKAGMPHVGKDEMDWWNSSPGSWRHSMLKAHPALTDGHMCKAHVGPGVFGFNAGHVWDVDNTRPETVSKALIQGRKIAREFRGALAEFHPAFKNSFLVNTGSLLGIRETRRIVGDYVLTIEDYLARRSFDDEISRNSYPIDVHTAKNEIEKSKEGKLDVMNRFEQFKAGESHGIPYRCLIPGGIRNVLVPGRLIRKTCAVLATALMCAASAVATETENHTLPVLPAPGPVAVDGAVKDWDLSGGVFACGELEHLRDQFAVWFHAMYDAENLYLLARWKDPTPLNNPENFGGHGFNGDCLQVRFIMDDGTPERTVTWWTMWRDVKGANVIDRSCPGPTNGVPDNVMPSLPRADEQGVKQAFQVDADGKGYSQEISIPWKLLGVSGKVPKAGDSFVITIEPNFTAGAFGRITIKDIFNSNVKAPDRIFTFRAYKHWGTAALMPKGYIEPLPVRVADTRTFPVSMKDGQPVVDWTGLVRRFEWPGFKPISFEMPFDGYVSLNIIAPDGTIARHLLNWDQRTKGKHTVQWDGLSDSVYRTPGTPLPSGEYCWKAIAHPGVKLTFRGWASYGGRVPWQSGPKDFWLGDHGVPTAVLADDDRIYLACDGAEGGRHLLATDFKGNFIWGLQNTTGAGDPEFIASADGIVYVLHPKLSWVNGPGSISRVDAATGAYLPWPGTKSHVLSLGTVWPPDQAAAMADHWDGLDARGGKIYATASDATFYVNDIVDWKAMVTHLKGDTAMAKRIMAEVDPETTKRLADFLAGKVEQERAFATWNGGPRFDREVVESLNKLLPATDLVPFSVALPPPRLLARANRAFLEKTFAPAIRTQPQDILIVLDDATGKVEKSWPLPMGGALKVVSDKLAYVISGGTDVLAIDLASGKGTSLISGLKNAAGINVDKSGKIYVSVGDPDNQVTVFDASGKEEKRIGRKGGRAPLGPWQADGMLFPAGVAVDKEGQLWVMERDAHPKRVSVWKLSDGKLVADFFGPTQYGASGSAINPKDPDLMVGVGCEWRLDPKTGRSTCVGTFDRQYHSFATFREGKNGKLYLYTIYGQYGVGGVQVWERLGDANFAKRAELRTAGDLRNTAGKTELWVDADGDGKEQQEEVQTQEGALFCAGSNSWSLNLGPDLTLYAQDWKDKKLKALPADGFNGCNAPKYDLGKLRPMPESMTAGYERNMGCALPSADNKMILVNLRAKDHPAGYLWHGFELASGKLMWTYPNPFFQVHGSHKAPAPDPGLFRGAYGPIGALSAKGVGDFWVINGNLGEWYALTSDGFFLTRLFNGNVFEWQWPQEATPGVDMTNLPPGCGGEDFGGSVTQADDGRLMVQSGKMAIWNILLTGLDQTVAIPGGKISLNDAETKQAVALREQALQAASAGSKITVKRATVNFTGNLGADFKGCEFTDFQKMEDARIRTALAYDDKNLYLGWELRDSTPWINGATDISQMYACGDTVDFQIGADPAADPKRNKAVSGDLRLSIGNYQGKPTAVLYKFVSADKKPRTFTSGVIQGWQVDWVDALADAVVKVKTEKERYIVEASVPLATLGLAPKPGLSLRGDVGATHADPSGVRTKLRTHWSNQQTGLVDDVVFELQPLPQNWGEIVFE